MSRILIVEARFYEDIADELVKGAIAALEEAGVEFDRVEVPGALEIPAAIAIAAQRTDGEPYAGYVALGCVIRGETSHYDYVCGESARGLQDLALWKGLSIGNGILTVENRDQAWARAAVDKKNKGKDAAGAALALVALKRRFGVE
ncbi:6,7-dimethyl-8-ribityllumazine synthase [Nisaea sp.]|uniref:6,7-dimethyl-8-ribityllumazine synthase n=1 Tax=Nisaea sp. TaxID=2024842 RepID=UPI0032EC064C